MKTVPDNEKGETYNIRSIVFSSFSQVCAKFEFSKCVQFISWKDDEKEDKSPLDVELDIPQDLVKQISAELIFSPQKLSSLEKEQTFNCMICLDDD